MKKRPGPADKTQEMGPPAPDSTSTDSPKAKAARDSLIAADVERLAGWADTLVRVLEVRRTRPRDEAVLDKLHADLQEATRSCLKQIGDISIHVDNFDLTFEGRCIRHSATRENSLAAALHRDGLSEIVFRQDLEPEELLAFVDILERAAGGSYEDSEGIVTLLWERELKHIDYVCVPFEAWEPESSEGGEGPADHDDEAGIPWPKAGGDEPGAGARPGGAADERSDDWPLHVHGSPAPATASGTPLEFTEIEAKNLLMVAQIEEFMPPRERVMEIVSAALAAEESPQEFLETARVVARLVECAVREGDWAGANELIDRFEGIVRSSAPAPAEHKAAADRLLQEIGRADLLGRLSDLLEREGPVDLGALTRFLARLGPSAAPALCDLLGEVGEMKIRRAICEALAISCKNDVDILIKRLSDKRWFLVRNILYVLGRIAHQGVERALGDALYHSDPRVRKEAVRAIGEIKSPTSRAYLNSALRDADKTVRMMVAAALAERNDERAARIIWGVIESPEFQGRDADERQAFFAALGATGSDALVPRLEETLTRGGLLPSRNQRSRTEAAMALAWLGTPAALAVLSREVGSRNEAVRLAVTEALEALRTSTPRKGATGWEHGPSPAGQ